MKIIETKYGINDVLEATKDIKLSRWTSDIIPKGTLMQVFQIQTISSYEGNLVVQYELGYKDKPPYFIKTISERDIDSVFKKVEPEQKPVRGKLTKEQALNLIEELPDNLDAFSADFVHGILDIKIFPIPKDEEYYQWYFGM